MAIKTRWNSCLNISKYYIGNSSETVLVRCTKVFETLSRKYLGTLFLNSCLAVGFVLSREPKTEVFAEQPSKGLHCGGLIAGKTRAIVEIATCTRSFFFFSADLHGHANLRKSPGRMAPVVGERASRDRYRIAIPDRRDSQNRVEFVLNRADEDETRRRGRNRVRSIRSCR